MGVVGHTDYVAGNDVTAEGQNDNENALRLEFNGNIDDTNIKALAAIQGSKLADEPNGVPTAKINKLSIITDRIADLAVTLAKINFKEYTNAAGVAVPASGVGGNGVVTHTTTLASATTRALLAFLDGIDHNIGMYVFRSGGFWQVRFNNSTPGIITVTAGQLKVLYLD